MSRIIKLLGSEVALGTATTVGNASLVRVINTGAVQVATVKLAAAVTGTITIGAKKYLLKSNQQKLSKVQQLLKVCT